MAHPLQSNLGNVAFSYARLLNIKITESSFYKELEENPFFPSLRSISDTFDRFHIDNVAIKVSSDGLSELSPPFIAWVDLPRSGTDFVLVTALGEKSVSYIYSGRLPEKVKREVFVDRFKGVVFGAEANEHSGEADFPENNTKEQAKKNKKKLLYAAMAFILLAIIAVDLPSGFALAYCTILAIKFTGLFLTVSLLAHGLDSNKGVVKRLCSSFSEGPCDEVLNSTAAKISGISLSDLGFFYFGSTTLILLVPGLGISPKLGVLSIFNALTIPYICYSIYFQWRVLKQWCPVCIGVLLTLAAELTWCISNFWLPIHSLRILSSISATGYGELLALLLTPVVLWNVLRPLLVRAKESGLYRTKYTRLLRDADLFQSLLTKQREPAGDWQDLGITIGNPNAANTLIKVCSPFCGPCSDMHSRLDRLLEHNDNVKLKIIFLTNQDSEDRRAVVASHILAIAEHSSMSTIMQALDDWYLPSSKDYPSFAKKYPVNGELAKQDTKILAMNNWCKKADIAHTPTLLLNGYPVPEEYTVEDLAYLF